MLWNSSENKENPSCSLTRKFNSSPTDSIGQSALLSKHRCLGHVQFLKHARDGVGWAGAEHKSWAIYRTTSYPFYKENQAALKQDFAPVLSLVGTICRHQQITDTKTLGGEAII